jgi:hypothetical protein
MFEPSVMTQTHRSICKVDTEVYEWTDMWLQSQQLDPCPPSTAHSCGNAQHQQQWS